MSTGRLRGMYEGLDRNRETLLTRWREYAALTFPGMLPFEGTYETAELPVPFSSTSARGANRLCSRLSTTLVPLNGMPFFNMELDSGGASEGIDPTEEQKALSRIERRAMSKLDTTNFRSAIHATLLQACITGNSLMQAHGNYQYSVHRVDRWVIRRRPDGTWHDLIICTPVNKTMLPAMLLDAGFVNEEYSAAYVRFNQWDSKCCIYTRVENNGNGGCKIEVEYDDKDISKSKSNGKPLGGEFSTCPYFPIRWSLVVGENYGRGLIEENAGSVRASEAMSEALLDSIAANAEYRWGVNPAGLTEIHDLQESENGSYVPAVREDVFPLQLANQAQVVAAQASVELKDRELGQVFLMNSAVQPTGDRVTAAMVRVIAEELEQGLSGVYSDSARELLIPVVRHLLFAMANDTLLFAEDDPAAQSIKDELSKPDSILSIKIKTGLESLNREIENGKITGVIQAVAALPEQAQEVFIWPGLMNRWLAGLGFETKGLVYSVDEFAQTKAQQQQQAIQQAASQQAIQTGGAIAEQAAANPQGTNQ